MRYLFGIPGAGAGPAVFKSWKELSSEDLIFREVLYNGRLARTYCTTMEEAASRSASIVLETAGKTDDIYLFGHCMGANVAYETAKILAGDHGIPIKALFVSAFISPDVPIMDGISDWDDDAFAKEIHSHGTFPEEFFVNPSLLKLFLPKVRADYQLIEQYCDREHVVLDCPIIGFYGSDDSTVTMEETKGWANYTAKGYRAYTIPGDHYVFYRHSEEILDRIRQEIKRTEEHE